MLIEHSFVTTLPAASAMSEAARLLGDRGFVAEQDEAFRVDQGEWNRLHMRRGAITVRKARSGSKCPQQIMMDWDRGRVNVAATIQPQNSRRSFRVGPTITSGSRLNKKQSAEYEAFLTAMVVAVESVLADGATDAEATQQWLALEDAFDENARKARRRSIILLIVIFAIIGALVALPIILAAANHH